MLFKTYFSHRSCSLLLLSQTNMEAWTLVSTSGVLHTADYVFYCILNYDDHILVGIKLSLPLDTGDNVLVGHVRWWVRYELSPSALSGLEASAHVCPRCLFVHRMLPGVDESQHTCSGVPAWVQSPGAHLSFHSSPRLMCWRRKPKRKGLGFIWSASLLHPKKHTLWGSMERNPNCWSPFPINSWPDGCKNKDLDCKRKKRMKP